MTSPNYTTDDLGASIRFSFLSRDTDSHTVFFIIYSVSLGIVLFVCGIMVFLANPSIKDLPISPFVYLWLLLVISVSLFIGISACVDIFFRLNGKEIVKINENSISVRHQILSYGITKTFSAENISCIFISRHEERKSIFNLVGSLKDRRFSNFDHGKVAFNVGKTYFGIINTVRFGSILTSDEAKQVVVTIYRKFPKYKCPEKSAG